MQASMVFAGLSLLHGASAEKMLAVQGHGASCYTPDWPCLSMNTIDVPTVGLDQALVKMKGASVNPVDIDQVEPGCEKMFGCKKGTIGTDGSGVVMKTGSACSGLKDGDEVYGIIGSTYAEYAAVSCKKVWKKPVNLSLVDAGAIGVVAGTSYQCLQALGLPSKRANLTVVITSGQGGTGAMAIQLAKAMGAAKVVTAASGKGIEYVKSFGADVVVDYHQQNLFDYLGDDSVDLVFDNLGHPGTADKAMHAIRTGGAFLVLLGGSGGKISENPKEGVKQISFGLATAGAAEFKQIAAYYDAGKLSPVTAAVYGLRDVPRSWTDKEHGKIFGKLAIDPSNKTVMVIA